METTNAFWKYLLLDCSLTVLINSIILVGLGLIAGFGIIIAYAQSLLSIDYFKEDFRESLNDNLLIRAAKYFYPGVILCIILAMIVGNIAKIMIIAG